MYAKVKIATVYTRLTIPGARIDKVCTEGGKQTEATFELSDIAHVFNSNGGVCGSVKKYKRVA